MGFQFETAYDLKGLTAMAKALRKTVRKKRSRRSHIFGWIVILLAMLLTLPFGNQAFTLSGKTVVTWLVALIIFLTLCFEDTINGYFALRRMHPGMGKAAVTFGPDSYLSETELGSTQFKYETILSIAETADYFVFIFSQSHAQIYSKASCSGGTLEEFRGFIEDRTGKHIERL